MAKWIFDHYGSPHGNIQKAVGGNTKRYELPYDFIQALKARKKARRQIERVKENLRGQKARLAKKPS